MGVGRREWFLKSLCGLRFDTLGLVWDGEDCGRDFSGDFPGPSVGIPRLLDLAEKDDQGFGILALDEITTVVKYVYHRIVIQPQECARVESKTLLDRDFDAGLTEDGFSLLYCHKLIVAKL